MPAPIITNVTVLGDVITITGTNLWQDIDNVFKATLDESTGNDIGSPPYISGLVDNAVSLNGTTQYLNYSASTAEITGAITYVCAIRTKGTDAENYGAISKWFQNNGASFFDGALLFISSNGKVRGLLSNEGESEDRKTSNSTIQYPTDGNWHFIAMTWDGISTSEIKILIDRVDVTNIVLNPALSSISILNDFQIGHVDVFGGGAFSNSDIDQVYACDVEHTPQSLKDIQPIVSVNSVDKDISTWIKFTSNTELQLDFGSSPPSTFPVTVENADGVSNTFNFGAPTDPEINLPDCSEVLWPIQPNNLINRTLNRSDSMVWQGGNNTAIPNTSREIKIGFRIHQPGAATFETSLEDARQEAHLLNISGYDFFNTGFSTPLVYVLSIDGPVRDQERFYRYDVTFKKATQ